jgi:hypothetical protein
MQSLHTGAPHFKSIAKQHRHANYTLEKVINEGVDNIIKKASKIHIDTQVDSDKRLQELRISDNYLYGFESINEVGIQNPFNMGHIKSGHDDDDETSEFGVGLKAGALSAANQLTVISRVGDDFYEVICNFIKMEKEEDVNASYNPKIRSISEVEYNQLHPFRFGSSIILTKIRETICERMSQEDLTFRIKQGISNTYSRFLNKNINIFVNGEQVENEINLFEDPKCKPFTIIKKLFVLEKGHDKIIIVKKTIERSVWQLYNKKIYKWEVLRNGEMFIEEKIAEGYGYAYPKRSHITDMSCIDIETTFAFYSDKFHTGAKNEQEKPFDYVAIYKDDRKYCNKSLENHNNGSNNFTSHKIEFSSKKIGKELGITFNKDITMDAKNDLTLAIRLAISDNRKEFSADTTSSNNKKSCEKAIRDKIIDLRTCNIEKLSQERRKEREELDKSMSYTIEEDNSIIDEENINIEQVIAESGIQEVVNSIIDEDNINIEQIASETGIQELVNSIIDEDNIDIEQIIAETGIQKVVDPVIVKDPIIEQVVTETGIQEVVYPVIVIDPIIEQVATETRIQEVVDPVIVKDTIIEQVVAETGIHEVVDPVIVKDTIDPRKLLIEASKLLMDKASSEICDIQLKDSIRILEFVKSIL